MLRSLALVAGATSLAHAQFDPLDKLLPDPAVFGGAFGTKVVQQGDTLFVGAPQDNEAAPQGGAAYVFEKQGGTWVKVDKLMPPGTGNINMVAAQIAVWEDTLVLGAPGHAVGGPAAGAVFIYERDESGQWLFDRKLQADDVAPSSLFGTAVGLVGDMLLVGAGADDEAVENGGAMYVFERVDGEWVQVDKIIPDDLVEHDFFGSGVEFDGERFVTKSNKNDDFVLASGKLYVYRLIDGAWAFEQDITREDAFNDDRFADSYALDGDMIAVGAPTGGIGLLQPDSAVMIYERQEDGQWTLTKTFDYDYQEGEFLGDSVDLCDGRLLIGASGDFNRMTHGVAFLYEVDEAGDWSLIDEVSPDWPFEKTDNFATGVTLTADTAYVSATADEEAGPNAGAVYVYAVGCDADVNGDGSLDVLDFVAFQQLFQAGDDAADCDANGTLDVLDFVCFSAVFQAGCF